ncbi:unnamed protein product [Brassicogethes aeneus]|uniref:Sodium-coupled monocarboxylate transporter 1 n=1 Tax=Brassicogethes aeneus TaxID=1431903 RepID=A0A9P0F894_BRAAE|nr:unnamed protein product [Brassicogethes aeneus]
MNTEAPEKIMQLLSFTWADYALFFSMFFLSVLIGIYFGCFQKKNDTPEEYLLGNRNMNIFPIAMSLIAGHLSGITLLGVPSEIYMYGGQYCMFVIVCFLIIIIMNYVYLPPFYNSQVSSSYEYLQLRFDEKIRLMALVLYVIASFFYIPIVIYIPALAFNQVTGMSIHYITPIICAICIFYTTIGGLKAVVWTDALQFSVTTAALLAVSFIGVGDIGGFGKLLEINRHGDRLEFFNMDVNPTVRTTFWGICIGLTTHWVSILGVNPSSVQRYMSVPSFSKAKITVLSLGLGTLFVKIFTALLGFIMYAKYHDCDPYTSNKIKNPDQILPFFVMDIAKDIPGLSGLFVAGVFSTALSTMSAHLNTLAGTLYEDFFRKFLPPRISANNFIKSTVVVCGVICVAMVFIIEKLGGIIQISGCFSGITSGPLLGLFTLGMLFPTATKKGALVGSITSLAIMSWIVIGFQYHYINKHIPNVYKPLSVENCGSNVTNINLTNSTINSETGQNEPFFLFRISFYWYYPIGTLLVVIVGSFVSWILGDANEKRFEKNLYSPIVHRFIPNAPADYVQVALKDIECEQESIKNIL